ncbi:MAG: ParB/RepB/Spo0J family partition protein [Amphiplicatus sp.]
MAETQAECTVGDTIYLPLSRLVLSKDNPRKAKDKEPDPVLTASIRAHGLLQNLGVRRSPSHDDKFEVRFGERRVKSLRLLMKEGRFTKEDVFPCKIVGANDEEAEEAAFAENFARKDMNPVDEFEAFCRLEAKGLTVAEIAQRFGLTEKHVEQRLALGNAAPCVRKALRAGDISLDIAKLFAGCPDAARQERVFKTIDKRGSFSAYYVKQLLYEGAVSSTDDIVRFVTLEAYEAAAGVIERDLFSDEVHLVDVELLHRLRDEKLGREAERLIADGWSWVDAHEGYSYALTNGLDRIYGAVVLKTDDEKAEIECIETELAEIHDRNAASDEWSEEDSDRYDELEERLSELKRVTRAFTPEQKAVSGCVIYPGRNGIELQEGLVRKEDRKKLRALRASEGLDGEEGEGAPDGLDEDDEAPAAEDSGYGVGLKGDLAVFRAQALQAALATDRATAVLVHQFLLVWRMFADLYRRFPGGSTLSASIADLRVGNGALGETMAAKILSRAEEALRTDIFSAGSYVDAWRAFRDLGAAEREWLVAFALARTIEPMTAAGFMDRVAFELGLNIRAFWKPTGENFFARVRKDQLILYLKDMLGPGEAARLSKDFKAKKSELVAVCEGLIDGTTPVDPTLRERIDAWAPPGMAFEERLAPGPEEGFDDEEEAPVDEDNAAVGDEDEAAAA